MNYKGFKLFHTNHGAVLEFLMPPVLGGKFFARFYARGALGDAASGEAALVWETLAPEYDMRTLVAPRQVHGVNIIEASESEALPTTSDADGIFIANKCAVLASLRYADCAPVVLACEADEPWMAILHSGFKGTMQNIAGSALARFARGGKIWAWIGPRICPRCYCRDLDDNVTQRALSIFSPECAREDGGKIFFDIGGEIRRQLIAGALSPENIFDYGGCTKCENELFYSYRAGDWEKRNFLLAGCATIRKNM